MGLFGNDDDKKPEEGAADNGQVPTNDAPSVPQDEGATPNGGQTPGAPTEGGFPGQDSGPASTPQGGGDQNPEDNDPTAPQQ